jgi:hypothetical protein
LDKSFIETMNVDPAIVQSSTQTALFALSLDASTGNVGQPPSQVHLPGMNQGDDHPQAGGEMTQVRPGLGLTHPGFQGMVETGVLFHSIPGFEWY